MDDNFSKWKDTDQNKPWSALPMNTWLVTGNASLISVQTKSTLNRNEQWELWPHLKVLRAQTPRGVQNHFQTSLRGTWPALHAGSVPSACTLLGQGGFAAFEVARLVNWKWWCHRLGFWSVTPALAVLGNLTWVQGKFSSMMPGFILILGGRKWTFCPLILQPQLKTGSLSKTGDGRTGHAYLDKSSRRV